MKTLSELKDLVARDFGYKSFALIPEEANFEMIEELIANRWNAQKTLIADHLNAEKALSFKTMTPDEQRKFEEDWHKAGYNLSEGFPSVSAYQVPNGFDWIPGGFCVAKALVFDAAAKLFYYKDYKDAMKTASKSDFKGIVDYALKTIAEYEKAAKPERRAVGNYDITRMTTETNGSRTTVTVESDYLSPEGWKREKELTYKKIRAKLVTLPWLLKQGTPLHLIIAKRLKEITLVVLLLLSFTASQAATLQAATLQPVKPAIWVSSQHRKAIRLTDVQTSYLRSHAPRYVQSALTNYAAGGTIRNNETADIIYSLLKDAKLI